MAQQSSIEWTQTTWNPVVGCTKVSEGCRHCYAERMAKRLAAMSRSAAQRGQNSGRLANYESVINRKGWNGRVYMDHSAIDDPISWRLPRTIFVNSMSDLFHDAVTLDFITQVFEVMNRCPQHTFQVLTKRPHRAAEVAGHLKWTPNIWLGTSVEDASVLERIAHLQRTPAQIRFLSVEPLLGPIPNLPLGGINWVIVGGESGPGARPIEVAWVRAIRDRCTHNQVPFFFKQWGGVNKARSGRILDDRAWDELPTTPTGKSSSANQAELAATA